MRGLFILAMLLPMALARTKESCHACPGAVRLLENAMSDTPLDAMVNFMSNRLCHVTADVRKCQIVMEGLLPVMAQWFKSSASTAHLCSSPQVCGAKLNAIRVHHQALERLPRDGTTCAMCSFVLNKVKAVLNDTTVQATIMEKLLEICNSLPTELAAGCVDFAQTYEPLVSQFIENADPDELCLLVGACMTQLVDSRPMPPALPSSLVAELAAADARLATAQAGPANDVCDVCQMAVIEAHSLITNPTVQSDLVNYTKALCGMFGGPLTEVCMDYVDLYAPTLFSMLEKYLSPELCSQLGMCQASTMSLLREEAKGLVARFAGVFKEEVDAVQR